MPSGSKYDLGEGPVVGFSGRMAPEKGLDVLGKTIPIVRERFPGVRYVLAGPLAGPDGVPARGPWDDIFDQYPGVVTKTGTLGMQDLADFYAAIDVLVLPSTNWTETFGMVQPEAMLCGTPCIASNLPGVREPIRRTGMGLIAEVGDYATWRRRSSRSSPTGGTTSGPPRRCARSTARRPRQRPTTGFIGVGLGNRSSDDR